MILDTSNYLSSKQEFRDVYGEMYMFLPAKVCPFEMNGSNILLLWFIILESS